MNDEPEYTPCKTPMRTLINASQKDVYDGADLRPYVGREGALDFINVPSRIGNQRTYRKDAQRPADEARCV